MATTSPLTISSSSPPQHYTVLSDGSLPESRLQQFAHKWREMVNHLWPVSIIYEGYRIQWSSKPIPWRHKEMIFATEEQAAVDSAVEKLLQAGIIEKSPSQSRQFLSNFFTIQEPTKRRPMLTLQNGRYSSTTGHRRRRRPHGKIRFERCVRGRANARRTKTFPFISSQGHRLPISLTGFQVERGTESSQSWCGMQ